MEAYQAIIEKLRLFTRKFYRNELIKGGILFFSLGLVYLFATLFIEYFLWLQPFARTLLFWGFIVVEMYLFFRFILQPSFKLLGLQKGISFKESSKIIGNHFPEVQDKLLNILQLQEDSSQSDLLIASIAQKANELQAIPFVKAIDFSKNTHYLKYILFPLFIFGLTFFTGNSEILTQSFHRVVNYKTAYMPPAPFSFYLKNDSLEVLQGKSFTVFFQTVGSVHPEEAKIVFNNQAYFLSKNNKNNFEYTFPEVQEETSFFVTSNGIQSQTFTLSVVKTPTILSLSMDVNYPNYLRKQNETIQHTGNLILPEGTRVVWKVTTKTTDCVSFISNDKKSSFKAVSENYFEFEKRIFKRLSYQITSSNLKIPDYERLSFSVDVVKDEYPRITIQSNIDSISQGIAQFAGQISDDYGFKKLEFVYYDELHPEKIQTVEIPIRKQNLQTFYFQFPERLQLSDGVNYKLFFQVFDNDAVNGSKKTKSIIFDYRKKSASEIEQALLNEQKNTINDLESTIQKQRSQQSEFKKLQEEIQQNKKFSWSDEKKVQAFIKRQNQYKKMMQRQANRLQENLSEKKSENNNLETTKEELEKRIEELRKLDQQQKLLDEIAKIAEKLNKEDFVKKAKELAQQNKQQERSLERTLELIKRFYVEQKMMQIANQVEDLSKEQFKLLEKKDSLSVAQKEIQQKFDDLQKELDRLEKDNENLKEPLELPDTIDEQELVEESLSKAEESILKKDSKSTSESQEKAGQKMKDMSAKMQQAMLEMEMDTMEENLEDLRKVLENLVTFSFQQEILMNRFEESFTTHPDFGEDLKKQNELKTYFEHIDDSLYVLAMRLPKITTKIQDELASTHYNLAQALENFSENSFSTGISNQRYVMTAVNTLADYLSGILDSMMNPNSMKMGKGKGDGFSLPDIIQKQGELSEKIEKGLSKEKKPGDQKENGKPIEPGEKGEPGSSGENGKNGKSEQKGSKGSNGQGGDENEDLDGELYEIFKEQTLLRQQLQDALQEGEGGSPSGKAAAKKVLKTMEELENEILEKGFHSETLQKMQNLHYEFLKLDNAVLEQGKDRKRKSTTNQLRLAPKKSKELEFKKLFYNQTEILNRQSLPLQQNYKVKVREYFSDFKNKKQ